MKNLLRRSGVKNERGATLVEFALVVPVLLMLVLGILEFGWLFNGWITVTASAREGARVAAVSRDKDLDKVRTAVGRHIEASAVSSYSVDPNIWSGEEVTVLVSAQIQPLVGFFVDGNVNLQGRAVMRRE